MTESQQSPQSQTSKAPKKDPFTVAGMIGDLDGGTFESKLDYALRNVAKALRNHESNKVKGVVAVTFKMQRIGEGIQLMVEHKIDSQWPTARGKKAEDDSTQTMMYTNAQGGLTIMPDNQIGLFEGQTQRQE
jgi:hypothetical protein